MLAAMALVFALQGVPAESGQSTEKLSSYVNGEVWEFLVTQERLEAAPLWEESAPTPPLSPRQALVASSKQLAGLVNDSPRWRLYSISLRPLMGSPNLWFYVVEYLPPFPSSLGGPTASARLVVLMDGSVITPTRRPEQQRT